METYTRTPIAEAPESAFLASAAPAYVRVTFYKDCTAEAGLASGFCAAGIFADRVMLDGGHVLVRETAGVMGDPVAWHRIPAAGVVRLAGVTG